MAAGGAPPNLVGAFGPQTTELTVTWTIPANAPAGSVIVGTITAFGPLGGSVSSIFTPIVEVWHILDLYVVGGPVGPDAVVFTLINGYVQNFQAKLSSINLNILTRYRLSDSIPIPPASQVSSSISTLSLNGATAVTQTGTYRVNKAPFTG
jgi:hypothetical protein